MKLWKKGNMFAKSNFCAVFLVHTDGDGAGVPDLWGGLSQRKMKAIIDTGGNCVILPGPGGFEIKLSTESRVALRVFGRERC